MLTKPTTFVLGAGSSYFCGMPLGGQLRDQIIRRCLDPPRNLVISRFGDPEATQGFAREFQRSGLFSIDEFLSRRPEYGPYGKHAIADRIMHAQSEAREHLLNDSGWYGLLWNRLAEDAKRPEDILSQQCRIHTFNYDMTLEHFLIGAAKSTFSEMRWSDAINFVQALHINHLYGAVGIPLSRMNDYVESPTPSMDDASAFWSAYELSVKNIRVMHDDREDSDNPFFRLGTDLLNSVNTFILGFSFNSLNVKRIEAGVAAASNSEDEKIGVCHACPCGMEIGERKRASQLWHPLGDLQWSYLSREQVDIGEDASLFFRRRVWT